MTLKPRADSMKKRKSVLGEEDDSVEEKKDGIRMHEI
jgi:hypothetical protein